MPTCASFTVFPLVTTLPPEAYKSTPQETALNGVYENPEIVLPVILPVAPDEICTPFWAIIDVAPNPVIIFPVTFTVRSVPTKAVAFFWKS